MQRLKNTHFTTALQHCCCKTCVIIRQLRHFALLKLFIAGQQHQQLILGRGIGKIIEYWRERGTRGMNMEQLLQVEQLCAALRTDMDGFHDVEIEYLMWLGAVKIDYALRLLLPGMIFFQLGQQPGSFAAVAAVDQDIFPLHLYQDTVSLSNIQSCNGKDIVSRSIC